MEDLILLDELELSVRSSNVLRNAGIVTATQFEAMTPEEVLALPGFSQKCEAEVRERIGELRNPPSPPKPRPCTDKQLKLRLPAKLHVKLERRAQDENISLNSLICQVLDERLLAEDVGQMVAREIRHSLAGPTRTIEALLLPVRRALEDNTVDMTAPKD